MKGAARDLMNVCIEALSNAYDNINSLRCSHAIERVRIGKSDTYGLDEVTEEVIKHCVDGYDSNIVLVTEETGKMYHGEKDLEPTQIVLIADPTDRSIKLKEFLEKRIAEDDSNRDRSVQDVVGGSIAKWEEEFGCPAISGAFGSLTAIKDRKILFNVMANYLTGDMFVSCPVGNKRGKIGDALESYSDIDFPSQAKSEKYSAFLGKDGYLENLRKCGLDLRPENCLDPWVGGPARILQLSSLNEKDKISFILSNGEKIGEWIGWLSWAKYARKSSDPDEKALCVYRIFFEDPKTRELVSVAPGPHYSVFSDENGETRINLDKMFQLDDPSHYRETFAVVPVNNIRPIARIKSLGKYKRELKL